MRALLSGLALTVGVGSEAGAQPPEVVIVSGTPAEMGLAQGAVADEVRVMYQQYVLPITRRVLGDETTLDRWVEAAAASFSDDELAEIEGVARAVELPREAILRMQVFIAALTGEPMCTALVARDQRSRRIQVARNLDFISLGGLAESNVKLFLVSPPSGFAYWSLGWGGLAPGVVTGANSRGVFISLNLVMGAGHVVDRSRAPYPLLIRRALMQAPTARDAMELMRRWGGSGHAANIMIADASDAFVLELGAGARVVALEPGKALWALNHYHDTPERAADPRQAKLERSARALMPGSELEELMGDLRLPLPTLYTTIFEPEQNVLKVRIRRTEDASVRQGSFDAFHFDYPDDSEIRLRPETVVRKADQVATEQGPEDALDLRPRGVDLELVARPWGAALFINTALGGAGALVLGSASEHGMDAKLASVVGVLAVAGITMWLDAIFDEQRVPESEPSPPK